MTYLVKLAQELPVRVKNGETQTKKSRFLNAQQYLGAQ